MEEERTPAEIQVQILREQNTWLKNRLRNKKEESQPLRHPKKYISKKKAIVRLREIAGDEIIQHEGLIYRLDKDDPSALALYGGHQVIVLNQELVDFEKWMIVSVTELW